MESLETKISFEPYWKADKNNILSNLEENHYLYCRKIDIEFPKEKSITEPDDEFTIPLPNTNYEQDADDNEVYLLFYRKSTLLKELLEKFDKTIKEHQKKNYFFFKVKRIALNFKDAFAAVTLLNVKIFFIKLKGILFLLLSKKLDSEKFKIIFENNYELFESRPAL